MAAPPRVAAPIAITDARILEIRGMKPLHIWTRKISGPSQVQILEKMVRLRDANRNEN
jgi:hypothetical protein